MPDWNEDDADLTLVGDRAPLIGPTTRNLAHLVVIAGQQLGATFKVEGPIVLGRGSDCDVRIIDDEISRRHARIEQRGKAVFIEDLGSRNGTIVNGERVVSTELRDGDKIQLGATTILKFTYHDDLEAEFQRRIYDAALRDPLTKAYNRRHFEERINAEIAFAKRHGAPLALLVFDLDHFKQVNDRFGHLGGDRVLVTVATEVARTVRSEDIFARVGGEEFAVLARGLGPQDAAAFGDRLRAVIGAAEVVFEGQHIPVTTSVGVASVAGAALTDAQALFAIADEALYEAKNAGRNRVVARAR